MATDSDLDVEVIDAAVAHTLYSAYMTNLAISMKQGETDIEAVTNVSESASRLVNALVRCGVDWDIPTEFRSAEDIMSFLGGSELLSDIGNHLVRTHGRRQEGLWMITCLLGGAFTGGKNSRKQLRPHLMALAQGLQLPAEVIDDCLNAVRLLPLRDWVSNARNIGNDSKKGAVFIGHGHSAAWRDLKDLLSDRLGLQWVEFNSESAVGIATKERLVQMLNESSFAFLVMTAEDSHKDGSRHARENVVHEIGLFQGRLGFKRAIVLLEDGCEEFSNLKGVGQIRFSKDKLSEQSEEIRKVLEREGMLPSK